MYTYFVHTNITSVYILWTLITQIWKSKVIRNIISNYFELLKSIKVVMIMFYQHTAKKAVIWTLKHVHKYSKQKYTLPTSLYTLYIYILQGCKVCVLWNNMFWNFFAIKMMTIIYTSSKFRANTPPLSEFWALLLIAIMTHPVAFEN